MNPETTAPNPALIGDIGGELLAQEATAREALATGKAPGPTTGLAALDEEIGGFMARGLHVLLAAPGAGKTSLALQIAGTCGCPALYVTSEMPRVELLRRIIARTTKTYLGKLRGGKMTADELRANITQAARACPMLALYDATIATASVADIQAKADALRGRFEASHVLIIVDSITDWAMSTANSATANPNDNDERVVAELALNGLKALTADLSGAVLAIAHRNRAGQNAKGGDRLHAAKGTGRYEYIAESVWDLDRDTGQEPDALQRTKAELTILKNRHGSAGVSIDLEFEGRLQKFTEA
jgi:replicative DNA helicase